MRRSVFCLFKKIPFYTRKYSTQKLEQVKTFPLYLTLKWDGEQESYFHYFWLRLHCPNSVHPKTKERIIGNNFFLN